MAKLLFIFLFFSLELTIHKKCGKVSYHKCHSHMTGSHSNYVTLMSHDKYGKVVHRLCSSCISSIENLIGTSLSSSCQLRLGE